MDAYEIGLGFAIAVSVAVIIRVAMGAVSHDMFVATLLKMIARGDAERVLKLCRVVPDAPLGAVANALAAAAAALPPNASRDAVAHALERGRTAAVERQVARVQTLRWATWLAWPIVLVAVVKRVLDGTGLDTMFLALTAGAVATAAIAAWRVASLLGDLEEGLASVVGPLADALQAPAPAAAAYRAATPDAAPAPPPEPNDSKQWKQALGPSPALAKVVAADAPATEVVFYAFETRSPDAFFAILERFAREHAPALARRKIARSNGAPSHIVAVSGEPAALDAFRAKLEKDLDALYASAGERTADAAPDMVLVRGTARYAQLRDELLAQDGPS